MLVSCRAELQYGQSVKISVVFGRKQHNHRTWRQTRLEVLLAFEYMDAHGEAYILEARRDRTSFACEHSSTRCT
jgi:hypothetical protein